MRVRFRPIHGDVLLAAMLTGLTVAMVREAHQGALPLYPLTTAVLSVAPVALRQRLPAITMLIITGAMALNLAQDGFVPAGGLGTVVAMVTVATLRPGRVTAALFTLNVVVIVLTGPVLRGPSTLTQLAVSVLILCIAWILGENLRRWSERSERAAARAERAAAEERVRIARELHDIVSHHMSVISLQAGLAEYVLDSDPSLAGRSIATVGEASREALLDMRRLLDVLRVDEGEDYHPQPGLGRLGELIDRTRAAGLPVTLAVTGRERELPAGVDLCAYRVVQESLTNVLKHASGAEARVEVDYGPQTLAVLVSNDGHRVPARRGGPMRHGIRGMRERAELYGGTLDAGPSARGFAVSLRLPLTEHEAAAA